MLLNGRVIIAYAKRRHASGLFLWREVACAAALVVAMFVGTVANLVPFQTVPEMKYRIRDAWEKPETSVVPSRTATPAFIAEP